MTLYAIYLIGIFFITTFNVNGSNRKKIIKKEVNKKIEIVDIEKNTIKIVGNDFEKKDTKIAFEEKEKKTVDTEIVVIKNDKAARKEIDTKDPSIKTRIVTVKNSITTDMISYKHWTGTYKPELVITVNDVQIKQNQPFKAEIKDNILKVRYDYSFHNGYRKGAEVAIFKVDNTTDTVDIFFSWKDTRCRIDVKNAVFHTKQDVPFIPFNKG